MNLPSKDEAEQYELYFASQMYEGLAHVGGVCFMATGELRACDEVISESDYAAERAAIQTANQAAEQARLGAISAANDLRRRPLPEHESMRWRTRVEIRSHARLEHHVPYPIGPSVVAYMRSQLAERIDGSIVNVVDIYHDATVPINDALILGREAAERLVDLLAVVTFAPAQVIGLAGTTPTTCRSGVTFDLAGFSGLAINSAIQVSPEALGNSVRMANGLALHHVRLGLNQQLPSDAFASLWNAMEVLATERARAEGAHRIVRCRSCGDERQDGWNTKIGFEALYADAGVHDGSFDKHRSTRSRVQHGAVASDIRSQRQILGEIGGLRSAAVIGVAKEVGLVPQTQVLLSPDQWPITVWACTATGSKLTATPREYVSRVDVTNLPYSACGDAGRNFRAGIIQQSPDWRAFPPVVD